MKGILSVICKIDCKEFIEALKKNEPMLVIFNHINFLEVPILVTHSYPLYVSGLVKSETWDNPIMSFIFNTYKAIPIDRKGAFSESFKKVLEAIKEGYYMCIAPEGTRSKDGVLGKGKPGIIQLALEAGVPILPVAHFGGENVWKNIRRFKRTPFCFKAGRPFRIKCESMPGKEEREKVMAEVMSQMARLLPEWMRGEYARYAYNDCQYLEFI
ncbi:lysophospholipid acyltransferase family protein [Treponema sp. R80B11-R83G3]